VRSDEMGNVCCKGQSPSHPIPIDEAPLDKALNPMPGGGGITPVDPPPQEAGSVPLRNNHTAAKVGGALAAGAAMSGVVAVTASVVSNARGVTEVSALAGAALLDLGRSIPFVAPVAYAIGTVVSLAETAADLKEDSRKFAKVILDVESALLAVGEGLREHRKNIEHIAEVLDEASTHLQRLQNKGWLSSIAWADHDKNNFGRMRDELSSCVGALNLAVTLDLANLHHSQFSQSAKLDALLGERPVHRF